MQEETLAVMKEQNQFRGHRVELQHPGFTNDDL